METRKRKRGIKASREKLEVAMLKKGFTTQKELAQKIADNENIDPPPKDMVNRVFREQAVSMRNLNRVSKALEVEPHSIFLTSEEVPIGDFHTLQNEEVVKEETESVPPSNKNADKFESKTIADERLPFSRNYSKYNLIIGAGLFAILIVVSVLLNLFDIGEDGYDQATRNTKISSELNEIMLIVYTPDQTRELANSLAEQLNIRENLRVVSSVNPLYGQLRPSELLADTKVHAAISFELIPAEYYDLVTLKINTGQHQAILGQWIYNQAQLEFHQQEIVTFASSQIVGYIEGNTTEPILTGSMQALEYVLTGINTLFTSHSVNEFENAQLLFEQAFSMDQRFELAQALLCLTEVRKSWLVDELKALENASQHCQKAEKLKPTSVYQLIAKLELLMKIGDVDNATMIADALVKHPKANADTFASLAEFFLHTTNNDTQNVLSFANRAIEEEPRHWRALNTLANYYFGKGNIKLAKEQLELASEVVTHEVIMANLGTMQLCLGELESARLTYNNIIKNFENNYLGHENLGTVYLMLNDFDLAVEHKQIAIDKQPEVAIHQVWSGLAEAYSFNGETSLAITYYTKAFNLIERDQLLEVNTLSDELHKVYYRTKLQELIHGKITNSQELTEKIDFFTNQKSEIDLKARSHLAWLAGKVGKNDVKQKIIEEISLVCPIYSKSPELKAL